MRLSVNHSTSLILHFLIVSPHPDSQSTEGIAREGEWDAAGKAGLFLPGREVAYSAEFTASWPVRRGSLEVLTWMSIGSNFV